MHKIDRDMAKHCQKLKESYPVILITGSRQSGKTTFSRSYYKNLPYVNLEDLQNREAANNDPKGFITKYPQGAIFDEIQKVPTLTSYLQGFVDEESFKGQFVLTGSQNFSVMNTLSQSLAGRAALLHLLPFSLFEISHRDLNPTNAHGDYVSTYLERDIRQLELIKKLNHFQRFVKLAAGRVGQIINYNSFSNDAGVSVSTIQEWLTLLEASYIIFRLPPFFENIGKRLIKQPKLYFYDLFEIKPSKTWSSHFRKPFSHFSKAQ